MPKDRKLPRPRNRPARSLESPLFRQRVVPSGKVYRRKSRIKPALTDDNQ